MARKYFLSFVFLLFIMFNDGITDTSQSKVSFEVPKSWKVIKSTKNDGLVIKLYKIKSDTIGSETHPPNVLIQYYDVPENITIEQADKIVTSHTKGFNYIVSAQDGPNWKTYIFTNYERDQQYIILYRIGIRDNTCAELMFCFPHIRDKQKDKLSVLTLNEAYAADKNMAGIFCDPVSVKEMVDIFNSVCEKFKISSSNQFKADVRLVDQPKNAEAYRHKEDDK